jgi:hypothetical protein
MSSAMTRYATGDGGSKFQTTQAIALRALKKIGMPVDGVQRFIFTLCDSILAAKRYAVVYINGDVDLADFLAGWKADKDRANQDGAALELEVREYLGGGSKFSFFLEAELDQNPKAKAELTTQDGITELTEGFEACVTSILAAFFPKHPEALQRPLIFTSVSKTRVRIVWPNVTVDAKQAEAMADRVRAELAVDRGVGVWICVCINLNYTLGPPLPGSCEYAGTERRDALMPLVPLPEEMTEWLVVPPTPAQPLAWERVPGTPYPINGLTPLCAKHIKTAGAQPSKVTPRIARVLEKAIRKFGTEYEKVQVTPECVIKSADCYIVVASGIGAHFCGQAQAEHCDKRARFQVTTRGIKQACFSASEALDGQCYAGSRMQDLSEGHRIALFSTTDWQQNHRVVEASTGDRDRAIPAILSNLAWAQLCGQPPKRSYMGAPPPPGTYGKGRARHS